MEPLQLKSNTLFGSSVLSYCVMVLLMTSSLFVNRCAEAAVAPACPSPCKCSEYQGNSDEEYSAGGVNKIDCQNMALTAVPDLRILEGSTVPNYLQLSQNEIKEISKDDFPPGLKIVILDLSSNLKVKISTNAFLNLGDSLKKFYIDAVDLAFDKTLDIFDSLFSLEFLSLEHNNKHRYTIGAVENVEATLLQGEVAKSLKKLHLAFCTIRKMGDATLKGLTRLEHLDLSNNWLISIPSTIKQLPNLEFLELFYCIIKSLKDDDFSGLPKLEKIDLSSNLQLATIEDGAFSGCENSLENLKLQRCALTQIPTKALSKLKKLDTLDLSENRFHDVGQSPLAGDYRLKHLVISSKNMSFHAEIFKGQEEYIEDLSIPRMDLKTVPSNALKTLTNLQVLSIEYNKITHLPKDAFSGLNVTMIRLDNNPITSIEKGAFNGLPPKIAISLRRTKMAGIDFLTDYGNFTIESVDLGYANLVCRCSMKDAIKVLQTIPHVVGTCSKGNKTELITSSRLGPILDEACEEERRNHSVRTVAAELNLMVISLVFAIALSRFVH